MSFRDCISKINNPKIKILTLTVRHASHSHGKFVLIFHHKQPKYNFQQGKTQNSRNHNYTTEIT